MLIAPEQRLTDDRVLVRSSKMPQKSLTSLFENERRKVSAFGTPPSMKLDRILAVVNAPLKRWQVPQPIHSNENVEPRKSCLSLRNLFPARFAGVLFWLSSLREPDLIDALLSPVVHSFSQD
jgi:hypothetical protein